MGPDAFANGWRRAVYCAIAMLSLGGLAACNGADEQGFTAVSTATNPPASCQPVKVAAFSPDWEPLPAAGDIPIPASVQAARRRILGPDATDPEQVKLWWYGVSSFIVAAGGHLFLLDAWEVVGLHKDYVPIGREDLVALKPEAIFIGHGHFDHAGDMGYVAGHTGATLIAGEATCANAKAQAARDGNQDNFNCLLLGNALEPAIGSVQQINVWADMAPVTVLRHVHSNPDLEDLTSGGLPLLYVPQLLPYLTHLNTDPQEILWFLQSLDDEAGNSPPGGIWAYHFQVGEFTLLWHDSVGPIADGKPHAKAIQCALDHFPKCVDVQSGAIVGFGALTSGLRDPGLYVQHAHPRIFLPNHHDAWAPVIGPGAEAYESQWRAVMADLPHPPQLDYLDDPEDYLQVRSYAVHDPRWREPVAGSSCAAQ